MTAYIMWYDSKSHKKVRYFVGIEKYMCPFCDEQHDKPSWDYEKVNATVLDDLSAATHAMQFATRHGYNDLQLEPIDETPQKAKPEVEPAPIEPVAS